MFAKCSEILESCFVLENSLNNIHPPEQIRMDEFTKYQIDLDNNQNLTNIYSISDNSQMLLPFTYHDDNIQKILDTWFRKVDEKMVVKHELLFELHKLGKNRKRKYPNEWKEKRVVSIRFKELDDQMVPYRYFLM